MEREFYIRMTRKLGWSKDILVVQIENRAYERMLTSQTNFDRTLPEKARIRAKLALKDEYTFSCLELGDEFTERQLEGVDTDNESGDWDSNPRDSKPGGVHERQNLYLAYGNRSESL